MYGEAPWGRLMWGENLAAAVGVAVVSTVASATIAQSVYAGQVTSAAAKTEAAAAASALTPKADGVIVAVAPAAAGAAQTSASVARASRQEQARATAASPSVAVAGAARVELATAVAASSGLAGAAGGVEILAGAAIASFFTHAQEPFGTIIERAGAASLPSAAAGSFASGVYGASASADFGGRASAVEVEIASAFADDEVEVHLDTLTVSVLDTASAAHASSALVLVSSAQVLVPAAAGHIGAGRGGINVASLAGARAEAASAPAGAGLNVASLSNTLAGSFYATAQAQDVFWIGAAVVFESTDGLLLTSGRHGRERRCRSHGPDGDERPGPSLRRLHAPADRPPDRKDEVMATTAGADLVQTTSGSSSTGTLALAATATDAFHQPVPPSFNGKLARWLIRHTTNPAQWELVSGVYTHVGRLLARPPENVILGTNGPSANVDFDTGGLIVTNVQAWQDIEDIWISVDGLVVSRGGGATINQVAAAPTAYQFAVGGQYNVSYADPRHAHIKVIGPVTAGVDLPPLTASMYVALPDPALGPDGHRVIYEKGEGSAFEVTGVGFHTPVAATGDAAADSLTFPASGWTPVNGDPVILRRGTMPGGVAEGQIYFLRDVVGNVAKLAATLGGPLLPLSSPGADFVVFRGRKTLTRQDHYQGARIAGAAGARKWELVEGGQQGLTRFGQDVIRASGVAAGQAVVLPVTDIKDAAYTALAGETVRTDTSGASFNGELPPNAPEGSLSGWEDTAGAWSDTNFVLLHTDTDDATIEGNDGASATGGLKLDGGNSALFRRSGTDWKFIGQTGLLSGGSGGPGVSDHGALTGLRGQRPPAVRAGRCPAGPGRRGPDLPHRRQRQDLRRDHGGYHADDPGRVA